jgi:hypothetical protein
MDEFFPLSKKWNIEYTRKMTREPPIGESEWDDYYSWLFCINVNKWLFPKILTWDKDKLGESPTASIYSVFHVNYPVDWLGRVTPIFVGAAAVNRGDALTDRSISATPLLNERWSELSAIYRIWKDGPKSEIVGFEHYRRLFLFKEQTTENREIFIKMEELVNYSEYLWNYKEICLVDAGTIILPKPFDAKMSVFDHYCLNHCTDDWCRILNIINENYPELLPFVAEQFDDSFFYANNLFISTWGFFSNLCSVWFDILQRFTDAVPIRQGMIYQNRDVSFLAERVFDIWIRYCRSRGLKIIHNPIVFVEYPPK